MQARPSREQFEVPSPTDRLTGLGGTSAGASRFNAWPAHAGPVGQIVVELLSPVARLGPVTTSAPKRAADPVDLQRQQRLRWLNR